MEKKYQIFISSTYEDLKKERTCAIKAVLQSGNIPHGMETFYAVNMKQMKLIERAIDSSDFCILIIGNRYGAMCNDKRVGYTEAEYNYAISKKKPVFVFIKKGNNFDSTELPEMQKKLKAFRKKLKKSTYVQHWENRAKLSEHIADALRKGIQNLACTGWIRCNPVYEKYAETIKCLPELGIKKLHHPCQNMPFPEKLLENAKSVKLMFISGAGFFGAHRDRFIPALEKGAEIRVIIATKGSTYVKEFREMEKEEKEFNQPYKKGNRDIKQAEWRLENLRSLTNKGTIFLGRCSTQLRGNMVIVDDKFAFYTPILQPMHSSRILTLELAKGKILDDCIKHFDTLYKILCGKGKVKEVT